MRKVMLLVLLLLGLASAQAWDFEVGRAYQVATVTMLDEVAAGPGAWYAMARYNIPATSEVLGAQLWLLPEVGVWVPDSEAYYGYARLQMLIDQTFGTLFADARARWGDWPGQTTRLELRFGLRFGLPPAQGE